MKFCIKCNTQLDENALFCSKCGAAQTSVEPTPPPKSLFSEQLPTSPQTNTQLFDTQWQYPTPPRDDTRTFHWMSVTVNILVIATTIIAGFVFFGTGEYRRALYDPLYMLLFFYRVASFYLIPVVHGYYIFCLFKKTDANTLGETKLIGLIASAVTIYFGYFFIFLKLPTIYNFLYISWLAPFPYSLLQFRHYFTEIVFGGQLFPFAFAVANLFMLPKIDSK